MLELINEEEEFKNIELFSSTSIYKYIVHSFSNLL